MKSAEYPHLTFVAPRSYTRGRATPPRVIVIHTTEGHEHTRAAEDGAAYDGRRTDGTSAHYYVDPDSIVQCVKTTDTAHTARYQGNRIGIHYELAGKAGQSAEQWGDANSRAIIRLAAKQVARDCGRYGIPPVRLTPAQVRGGGKGICGHVDITKAFPEDQGTHWDPGPNFPWAEFVGLVRDEFDKLGGAPSTKEGDTVDTAELITSLLGTRLGRGTRTVGMQLQGAAQAGAVDIVSRKLDLLIAAHAGADSATILERLNRLAADAAHRAAEDAHRDDQLRAILADVAASRTTADEAIVALARHVMGDELADDDSDGAQQ